MARDFKRELEKQLRFLATSCAEFDGGNEDEGVRIATTLAVILHDSRTSQSLLTHLKLKRVRLLSTSSMMQYAIIGNLTSLSIDVGTTAAQFSPKLENTSRRLIPFEAWWNREMIFLRENRKITRRDLVLGARNKDGGAHVDADLSPEYEWMANGAGWKMTQQREGTIIREWSFYSAHLASLRQIGFEVLNSPALEEYTASIV